jgi:hypothetical protein
MLTICVTGNLRESDCQQCKQFLNHLKSTNSMNFIGWKEMTSETKFLMTLHY